MRRAIAAFFLNLYHFFAPKATQPNPVDRSCTSKPLHPRLLAALLGVSRINDSETWEICDRQASQIRKGYEEVEALCGQIRLLTGDLLRHLNLDVLGITGDDHKILVEMFSIRFRRMLESDRIQPAEDARGSGKIVFDQKMLDEPLVTRTIVTYGNPAAVEADQNALELLLQRGEVHGFGICADGITYFVVLQRGELEVVICSRG